MKIRTFIVIVLLLLVIFAVGSIFEANHEVVLNQPVPCTKCGALLPRGRRAFTDLSDHPDEPRAWLCARAVESLNGPAAASFRCQIPR